MKSSIHHSSVLANDQHTRSAPPSPLSVFISYSRKDEPACQELLSHLALLKRQQLIREWYDQMLIPGEDWSLALSHKLDTADIILLLISKDFLASDFCYGVELTKALARHGTGQVRVVPIMLRPCDTHAAPFTHLQALPKDARPVSIWNDEDEAWTDVVNGIRAVVKSLQEERLAQQFDDQDGIPDSHHDRSENSHSVVALDSALAAHHFEGWAPWATDARDLLSNVLGRGGLKRIVSTFSGLTFRPAALLRRFAGQRGPTVSREQYLTPLATIAVGITLIFVIGAVREAATGSGNIYRGLAFLVSLLVVIGTSAIFALLFRLFKVGRFGACLAVACYVQGAAIVPVIVVTLVMTGLLFVSGKAAKVVPKLSIAGPALVVMLAILIFVAPWIYARAAAAIVHRWRPALVVGIATATYFAHAAGSALVYPGESALILSTISGQLGYVNVAEELSQRSLQLAPDNETVWISRICRLSARGDKDELVRVINAALENVPNSAQVHYYAALHSPSGSREWIESHLTAALALRPEYSEAATELAIKYLEWRAYDDLGPYCDRIMAGRHFDSFTHQTCAYLGGIAHYYLGHDKRSTELFSVIDPLQDSDMYFAARAYRLASKHLPASSAFGKTVVLAVMSDSLASSLGISPGDILLELNGTSPAGVEEWRQAIAERGSMTGQLVLIGEEGRKAVQLPAAPKMLGVSLGLLR